MAVTMSPSTCKLYYIVTASYTDDGRTYQYEKPVDVGYATGVVINVDGNKVPIFTFGSSQMRGTAKGMQDVTGYIDQIDLSTTFFDFLKSGANTSRYVTALEQKILDPTGTLSTSKNPGGILNNNFYYKTITNSSFDGIEINKMVMVFPNLSQMLQSTNQNQKAFLIFVVDKIKILGYSSMQRATDVQSMSRVTFYQQSLRTYLRDADGTTQLKDLPNF